MSPTEQQATVLPAPIRRLIEERINAKDLELPVLPGTATQVMDLCSEEDTDARQIADLLNRDQALAGHVLQVSNSAAYAPKEPIVSLQQSVSRLGIGAVCEITLAVALKGRVFRVPGHQGKIREMWMHSAATAAYSKEVARMLRHNVEGAFLCGLLHDAGKPLVMQMVMDIAAERTATAVPMALLEAAMTEYHPEVAGRMVEQWELPAWMSGAIRYHHASSEAGEFEKEAQITYLSDMLCHWALNEELGEKDFAAEDPVIEDLGFYGDDIAKLLGMRDHILKVIEAFL